MSAWRKSQRKQAAQLCSDAFSVRHKDRSTSQLTSLRLPELGRCLGSWHGLRRAAVVRVPNFCLKTGDRRTSTGCSGGPSRLNAHDNGTDEDRQGGLGVSTLGRAHNLGTSRSAAAMSKYIFRTSGFNCLRSLTKSCLAHTAVF